MPKPPLKIPKTKRREIARRIADALSIISPKQRLKLPGNPQSIGVLLQWGIGDAVLALGLVQGLVRAFPSTKIDLLGKPWLSDLFADETGIHEVLELVPPWTKYQKKYRIWESDWRRYFRQVKAVRARRYDLILTVRFDVRDNLQLRILGATRTAGFRTAGGRYWVTEELGLGIQGMHSMHRAAAAELALLKIVGSEYVPHGTPEFFVSDELKRKTLMRLRDGGFETGPIITVYGGAGHPIRRWGGERFSSVLLNAKNMGAFIVILTDESSPDAYGIHLPSDIPHMLWQSSLSELKGLFSFTNVFLGADSGPTHLAAACGCPVVALFGPASVEWFGPIGEGHHIVKVDPMPCRPCYDACIYPSPICMDNIEPQRVWQAIVQSLTTHPRWRGI